MLDGEPIRLQVTQTSALIGTTLCISTEEKVAVSRGPLASPSSIAENPACRVSVLRHAPPARVPVPTLYRHRYRQRGRGTSLSRPITGRVEPACLLPLRTVRAVVPLFSALHHPAGGQMIAVSFDYMGHRLAASVSNRLSSGTSRPASRHGPGNVERNLILFSWWNLLAGVCRYDTV